MEYSVESMLKRLELLQKEKDSISRTLQANEEANAQKVDTKTTNKMTWWQNQIIKSEENYKREMKEADDLLLREMDRIHKMVDQKKAGIKRDYDNSFRYNHEGLSSVQDKLPPKTERIINMEIRLKEVNSKIDYLNMFLANYKKTEEPDYVNQVIIPAKTWVCPKELDDEAKKVMASRPAPEPEIQGGTPPLPPHPPKIEGLYFYRLVYPDGKRRDSEKGGRTFNQKNKNAENVYPYKL